jgi:RNA polymerase sigma-70 factor, ECF subfamily
VVYGSGGALMLAPEKTARAAHWPSPGGHEESSRYAGRDEDVPDTYLVQRTQEGYLDAYSELVDRHGPRAFRVALRLLGNQQDAEDVTQEALVAAWQQLPRFRGDASYPTWLFRIVTRRALNRITRAPAADSLDRLSDVPCPAAGPAREVERTAAADAVTAAVAALPPPQRLAIVLHHFEGLPNSEVARITASTVPAVRSHLLRGRRTLAGTLRDWG